MNLRRTILAVGAAMAVVLLLAPTALAQEDESQPTLEANLAGAGFGERVIVSGTNWPANSIVQVEVCGNLALNGTSDCDQTTAFQSGVSAAGTFGAVMLVGNPPVPCPCVFRAKSLTSTLVMTVDFEVRGAAFGDTSQIPLPERRLDVTDARIEGSGPWTALFGARPDRTLVFTVVNTGFVAVNDPSIVLGVGKGANPEGFVAPPQIDRLEPGESVTLRVDLDLPAFAIGTYAVVGSIPGFETPVAFRAETSHIPWLLLIVPTLILAQLALLGIRNRVRARVHRAHEAEVETVLDLRDQPTPDAAYAPVAAAVAASTDADTRAEESSEDEATIDLSDSSVDVDQGADDLARIIGEEISSVLRDAADLDDSSLSPVEQRDTIIDLSDTAATRVAARAGLSNGESSALHERITGEMLAAFGLEPSEPA